MAMTTRPGSREAEVVLQDGSTVHLCRVTPCDTPAMHQLLTGLSDRPERAEVALEVADAMQGKGLGTVLLCQLAEAANQMGIQVFDAEVLPENHRMLRVIRDCGFPVKVHSLPGVLLVELRTCLAAKAPKGPEPWDQAA